MAQKAVEIEGLSKKYFIGRQARYDTLQERLMGVLKAPFQRIKSFGRSSHRDEDTIWALRDISFDVQEGEVMGIIGRNGSGKSTLLKILARITEPTEGRATLRGRVGSLLEVGTGFHQELTGRENVYLSGAILGMSRAEGMERFEEIVEFSGVGRFIDTPVKRYSSGMRVRLGFAVAAHLQPEILIIDEVLAVGDAEFRKKCLGKMDDVARQGRTVLFVSHNMSAVRSLCSRCVLLDAGEMIKVGPASEVVDHYMRDMERVSMGEDIPEEMHKRFPPGLEVFRAELLNRNGQRTQELLVDERATLVLHYKVNVAEDNYILNLWIRSPDGFVLAQMSSAEGLVGIPVSLNEDQKLVVSFKNPFKEGKYFFVLRVISYGRLVDVVDGVPFSVGNVSTDGGVVRGKGFFKLESEWSCESGGFEGLEKKGGDSGEAG